MSHILSWFLWGFISLVGLIAVIVIFGFVYLVRVALYAETLMFGVPWMTWLTLDEVVEMGHPRHYCMILLPVLHDKNYLEVRYRGNSPPEEFEFSVSTIDFYEFRFIKRRKKRKFGLEFFPNLSGTWKPANA